MAERIGARLLALVDGDDRQVRARRIAAFEQGIALVIAVEYWLRAIPKWGLLAPHYYVLLAVATVACAAVVVRRGRRTAFLVLAASHLVLLWSEFPSSGNHAYLELLLCLLASLLVPDDEAEGLLYLRAVRWVVAIVFFYSGVQKLAHGYWPSGEYLAFSLGSESYRSVLGWLVPADELARLARLHGEVGDGPYRLTSLPLRLLSNFTWMAEIAIAPALCWQRTRAVAMVVALLLLAAIEAVARELFFGIVLASMILMFARGDRQTAARSILIIVLSILFLIRLGFLPELVFY